MSLHSDIFLWFRFKQSMFLLFIAACLAVKQQITILLSFVWPDGSSTNKTDCHNNTEILLNVALDTLTFMWLNYYVSPLNEGRHIVLVWFFLLPLLLSKACPDHNFFVFPDRSMILVCGCMTIRRCVVYHNDLWPQGQIIVF